MNYSKIIPSDDILLERYKENILQENKRLNLAYKNKQSSNNKFITLVSENPFVLGLRRNGFRIEISRESFLVINEVRQEVSKILSSSKKKVFREKVKNKELLKILKIFDPGKWEKCYEKDHSTGKEVHYFKSEKGLVYGFKLK